MNVGVYASLLVESRELVVSGLYPSVPIINVAYLN